MAPVTSSNDRSKRQKRSKAAVRSDKGRQNRQSASTAKVTNSSDRKVTNKAKVTKGAEGSKQRPALPPGKKGGELARKGALTKQGSSQAASQRVEPVRVREVQQSQARLTGTQSRRLPPAGQQSANRTAQTPPRSANTPRLPGAKGSLTGLRGGIAGAGVLAAGEAVLGPVARKAGEALGNAVKRQADGKGGDYMRQGDKQKANSGALRRRVKPDSMETQMQRAQRNAEYRRASLERTNRIKSSIPDAPKSANDGQRSRMADQRRASGGVTSTPQPRQSAARPSQSAPRTATAGTAGQGRKWEDFNPGRGTSETSNPLIKKDSWLMGKIKQREETQAKNVGPVADGGEYSASKKSADIVARRKKKEEEDKKKAQQ